MSILGKNPVTTAGVAAAFVLVLASGCGAPADITTPEREKPTPTQPSFRGSPDKLDRLPETGQPPSVNSAPCVFSADAAERLGRTPCLS